MADPGGEDASLPPGATTSAAFPIVEERAEIRKRTETVATVQVSSRVRSQRVPVEEPCRVEDVVVERVQIGRWVDGPQAVRDEPGGITVFPVVEEVPVVVKRYRLVEEVRVAKRVRTETFHDEVEVTRSEVSVNRSQANEGKDAT